NGCSATAPASTTWIPPRSVRRGSTSRRWRPCRRSPPPCRSRRRERGPHPNSAISASRGPEATETCLVTLSATVDVSDSLDEARTRLEKTARALNGAWAAALCSMIALVVASLALLLVAVSMRPVYVVIWSVLLTATGYNLTRFWPRRHAPTGQLLSKQEVA